MRILIVTDAWEPQVNGVVRTLSRTIAELRAMGHEVRVIEPSLFKTFPCPTYPEIRLAWFPRTVIEGVLSDFEPEAVHLATEGPLGWAARAACVDWNIPFTTSYHTQFPEYVAARFPIPLWLGYAYMRAFHNTSGRVMIATPTMYKLLERKGFKNLSIWSRGVDTDQFRPGLEPVYGDLPRPIFLSVGRVAVEKNIRAFLQTDLPGSKVVVGDGPLLAELKTEYPDVVFTGSKFGADLARHFADADVFVFPSLTDTFGLVILEGMAAGLPVAAYPAPGPIDIIPGSGAGVVDADLRTACLNALKISKDAARAHALKNSWRACAEAFFENLTPLPQPEKERFWRRLKRRLARLRRKPA
jgi:glycosyltransferase involved in cell wall biosynthesis